MNQETKIPHGTLGGYTNHRCRCAECREANRVAMADYRRRTPERDPVQGLLYSDPRWPRKTAEKARREKLRWLNRDSVT